MHNEFSLNSHDYTHQLKGGATPTLFSWLIIILVAIFFMATDLSVHLNGNTIEEGYFKSRIPLIISLLFSWFISKELVPLLFPNSFSETVIPNSFGLILITIALTILLYLFNQAKHDIETNKKTVQQAQSKYFKHNQALTFAMVHYVIGISSIVLINSFMYLPIFLDFLIPISKNDPSGLEKIQLQDFIAINITFVIPFLIMILTPFFLKKSLSHFDK